MELALLFVARLLERVELVLNFLFLLVNQLDFIQALLLAHCSLLLKLHNVTL
jgi:hypothetical protein